MSTENDLSDVDGQEDEVLRIANELFKHVASGSLPPNVIAAIGAAMTVLDYSPSDWDELDSEEVLVDCCAMLIQYSITFTRHLNAVESEPLISEASRIAVQVFGQECAELAIQRVADLYREKEDELLETLERPARLN